MNASDKRDFKDVLTATMDLYGKELSIPVLQLWFAALEQFSIEEVRAGLSRYVRSTESGTFPPKPADVIRMIEGSAGDRGLIAWGKVNETIARAGGYQSVCFDDPIIHCVIEDMGGWPKLCATSPDEIHFRSADFAKRYRAYAERGIVERHSPYLPGRAEEQNRIGGHRSNPPLMIGDQSKCKLIMEQGKQAPRLEINEMPVIGKLLR